MRKPKLKTILAIVSLLFVAVSAGAAIVPAADTPTGRGCTGPAGVGALDQPGKPTGTKSPVSALRSNAEKAGASRCTMMSGS